MTKRVTWGNTEAKIVWEGKGVFVIEDETSHYWACVWEDEGFDDWSIINEEFETGHAELGTAIEEAEEFA